MNKLKTIEFEGKTYENLNLKKGDIIPEGAVYFNGPHMHASGEVRESVKHWAGCYYYGLKEGVQPRPMVTITIPLVEAEKYATPYGSPLGSNLQTECARVVSKLQDDKRAAAKGVYGRWFDHATACYGDVRSELLAAGNNEALCRLASAAPDLLNAVLATNPDWGIPEDEVEAITVAALKKALTPEAFDAVLVMLECK